MLLSLHFFRAIVIHVSNNSKRQSTCRVTRIKRKKKRKTIATTLFFLSDSIFSVSEIECNFKKLHSRFISHVTLFHTLESIGQLRLYEFFSWKREQVNSESRLSYVATPLLEHSSFDSRRTVFLNLWFTLVPKIL